MKRLRRILDRIAFTRAESTALIVVTSLYLVGFTWRYVQQTTVPFDKEVYAALDSLIAAGGLVPTDTLPKPKKGVVDGDSLAADTLGGIETDLVNVNRATVTQLIVLPGIGPALARRIVDHREANGPFARIEDLENVKGIGPAKLERMRSLVAVE